MNPLLDHARSGGLLCIDHDGDGCCDVCRVEMLTDCPCGGIGYHLDGCRDSEEASNLRVYSRRGSRRVTLAILDAHRDCDEALWAHRHGSDAGVGS